MRPIDPIALTTIDGKERRFLLSMGAVKRIKARFGAKSIKDVLDKDAEEAGVPILFEALQDKGDLTEEQFADLLPADLPGTVKAIAQLLGASFPDRPTTPASPAIQ